MASAVTGFYFPSVFWLFPFLLNRSASVMPDNVSFLAFRK
ncbi:hypothetical protein P262_02224 [Cronobacter malonaticus]|uniref:Uncharacterized protein n=1 Tax=Cronobacter malonaticus TaxID=413503 RepID=V5TZ05_9ENTR|nr:hypothetical protein P262_02224 [Cronobacter malonaticus]CCJ93118.1 hypothetical protein BN131_791 [Cronobacter malonaticus 681]